MSTAIIGHRQFVQLSTGKVQDSSLDMNIEKKAYWNKSLCEYSQIWKSKYVHLLTAQRPVWEKEDAWAYWRVFFLKSYAQKS